MVPVPLGERLGAVRAELVGVRHRARACGRRVFRAAGAAGRRRRRGSNPGPARRSRETADFFFARASLFAHTDRAFGGDFDRR